MVRGFIVRKAHLVIAASIYARRMVFLAMLGLLRTENKAR